MRWLLSLNIIIVYLSIL